MILPKNNNFKIKSGKLKNNLKYALINDKNQNSTTICVVVKIGSINEKKNYMGLAHFLEHMLFLGSKKYPEENYFDKMVKKGGGSMNAYTDIFETVYYFDILNDNLEHALDVFSRFFIDPKFDKNSVDKELNAINSEHMKNINNDMWRINQVIKNVSKKDSQFNTFSTGNLKTLDKPDVREKMIRFYNEYYCSDNMSVTLISNLPVSKLEKIFNPIFSNIPNKESKKKELIKPFFNMKSMKDYQVLSLNKINEIMYIFELPTADVFKYNHLISVITDVITSKKEGSLNNYLKKKKLIDNISIYYSNEGIFRIMITMNHFDNDKINKINSYVKYFCNNLYKLNWDEIMNFHQNLYKFNFNYNQNKNPLDIAIEIGLNLFDYTKDNIYAGSKLIKKFDDIQITKFIKKELKFSKCFIIYINDKFKFKDPFVDKYYKTEYDSYELKVSSKKFNLSFTSNVEILKQEPKIIKNLKDKIPKKINNIWFGSTSKYDEPNVYGYIYFDFSDYFKTTKDNLLCMILSGILNENIKKKYEDYINIGYSFNFSFIEMYKTLCLSFTGLNSGFKLFFEEILSFLKSIKIDKNDFEIMIDRAKKNISNEKNLSPWWYLDSNINSYYYDHVYTSEDYLKELKNITILDVKKLSKILYRKSKIQIFMFGNYEKENIPSIDYLKSKLKKKIKPIKFEAKELEKEMIIKHPNKKETNNLLQYTYTIGEFSEEKISKLLLLQSIIENPIYDFLRTKNQLGYLVKSILRNTNYHYTINLKVQSEKKLDFIEDKMKAFLQMFTKLLNNMISKDFNQWKKTLIEELSKEDVSLYNYFDKYRNEILSNTVYFNRIDNIIKEVKKVEHKDLVKFYNDFINDDNLNIIKIII
jgi:insulysin